MKDGKLIILSAPSGAGKTTIMKEVVKTFPQLEFSISETSRPPRGTERHGVDYYFVTARQFEEDRDAGKFVEWEEVYGGTMYGTLRSEMERIWDAGRTIIFDVDVAGGNRLKDIFGDRALSIFIMPPSTGELRKRLMARGTDSPETIEKRIAKADREIAESTRFDRIVINDSLPHAVAAVGDAVREFTGND